MRRWLGIIALLALAACRRELSSEELPAAVVAMENPLEFGVVPVMESTRRWVELQNRTSTALHITRVDVLDHAAFSVEASRTEIPAFQSFRLPVDFHPQTRGAQRSTLTVLTDSAVTPGLTVTLNGTGEGTAVALKTPVLDFEAVLTGEQKTLPLIIVNEGSIAESVTIADPSSVSAFFTSGSAPTGTLRVEPGATLQLPVTFVAFARIKQDVKLRVRLCAECNTTEVSLVAQAVESYFFTNPTEELLFDDFAPSPKPGQRVLPLAMLNSGSAPVTITAMEIVGGGDWVSLDQAAPLTVPPQGQQSVKVTAKVDGLTHEGVLKLTTTDTRRPEVLIKLTAPETPAGRCLVVTPSEINFGVSQFSCPSQSRSVAIYNTCPWPLSLTKASLTNGGDVFRFVAPQLPRVMTPGSPARIDVLYDPREAGSFLAELKIELSDVELPISITLQGIVQSLPKTVDTFQQSPREKADMLFIIDDSPSMASYQQSIEKNLSDWKAYIDNQDVETNLAVTTMDVSNTGERGHFVPVNGNRPRVVDDQTPDSSTVFHDNANVGIAGSTTQHGLEAMSLAFDSALLAGDNAGFLRPDAFLSVFLISASPEASAGLVDDYLGALWALKGTRGANKVAIFTVSVPTTSGDRYAEAARTTGGISTSIDLRDWEQEFKRISLLAYGQKTHFILSAYPGDPASIQVKVDGQVVPATEGNFTSWWYTKSSNSVDFNTISMPPPGSTIEISYDLGCP